MEKKNEVVRIDPSLVSPINWKPNMKPEDLVVYKRHLDSQKAAPLASLPMICKWQDCSYKAHCPLWQMKIDPPPIGQACPYEIEMINGYLSDYMRELEVTVDDITDLALIKEMITWHIYEWRAQAELSQEPNIIRDAVIGYDADSNEPVMKEIMNPIILMLEKTSKARGKIRDALLATREAKARAKGTRQVGLSELSASIQAKIEATKKARQQARDTIIDVMPMPKSEE